MSILILEGPGPASARLDEHAAASLWRTAWRSGHVLEFEAIADIAALASSIRAAGASACGFVLLHAGDLASSPEGSQDEILHALQGLDAPFVEVCGRSARALDFTCASRQPVATIIIDHDPASRFRIALGIALRRLSSGVGRRRIHGRPHRRVRSSPP